MMLRDRPQRRELEACRVRRVFACIPSWNSLAFVEPRPDLNILLREGLIVPGLKWW